MLVALLAACLTTTACQGTNLYTGVDSNGGWNHDGLPGDEPLHGSGLQRRVERPGHGKRRRNHRLSVLAPPRGRFHREAHDDRPRAGGRGAPGATPATPRRAALAPAHLLDPRGPDGPLRAPPHPSREAAHHLGAGVSRRSCPEWRGRCRTPRLPALGGRGAAGGFSPPTAAPADRVRAGGGGGRSRARSPRQRRSPAGRRHTRTATRRRATCRTVPYLGDPRAFRRGEPAGRGGRASESGGDAMAAPRGYRGDRGDPKRPTPRHGSRGRGRRWMAERRGAGRIDRSGGGVRAGAGLGHGADPAGRGRLGRNQARGPRTAGADRAHLCPRRRRGTGRRGASAAPRSRPGDRGPGRDPRDVRERHRGRPGLGGGGCGEHPGLRSGSLVGCHHGDPAGPAPAGRLAELRRLQGPGGSAGGRVPG
jgi:hypothetical protein